MLLLRELRKLTKDPKHPEIACLDKAEIVLDEVARDVEKTLCFNEKFQKLIEIAQLITVEDGDAPVKYLIHFDF